MREDKDAGKGLETNLKETKNTDQKEREKNNVKLHVDINAGKGLETNLAKEKKEKSKNSKDNGLILDENAGKGLETELVKETTQPKKEISEQVELKNDLLAGKGLETNLNDESQKNQKEMKLADKKRSNEEDDRQDVEKGRSQNPSYIFINGKFLLNSIILYLDLLSLSFIIFSFFRVIVLSLFF